MKKFLSKNWIGLLGLFIGLFGLGLAVIFYARTLTSREPVFVVDPNRTEIIRADRISDTPLRVVRAEGGEISGDITSVRVYLWNRGKLSIKPENILRPLKLTLNDPEGEILDFRILKYSREVIALEVKRYPQDPKRVLSVDFKILEQDDGFCLQIIYVGSPSSDIIVEGQIEGVSYPFGTSQIEANRFWVIYRSKVFIFGGFMVIVFLVTTINSFIRQYLEYMSESGSKPATFYLKWSTPILAVLLFYWVFILLLGDSAKEEAKETLVESVPASIVPLQIPSEVPNH